MASFVSSKDLSAARELKREARKKLLDEEEGKFRHREEIKQKHKGSGNDRWMLPGIEKRIQAESSRIGDSVSDDSSSKKKKHKKKKKKKASSSEESDSEKWEEKPATKTTTQQREDWMNFDFLNNDSTYTSSSLKEEKKKRDEEATKELGISEAGQHPKELNPYWKAGGTGLPSERSEKIGKPKKIHKEWLLKSLKRMNEQAEEQGRSIESIAAERYGSWEEFQNLLREASPGDRRGNNDKSRHKHDDKKKRGRGYMRPDDYDDHGSRHSDKYESSGSKSGDRRESENSSSKSVFMKPPSEDDYGRRHSRKERHDRSKRPAWKKVKEHEGVCEKSKSPDFSKHPSWTKSKATEDLRERSESPACEEPQKSRDRSSNELTNKKQFLPKKECTVSKPEEPREKQKDTERLNKPEEVPKPEVKILSEKEKNQLAAKILKAELMGNEKLAEALKQKLEKAREAEKNMSAVSTSTSSTETRKKDRAESSSDEETVVLTRMGKNGQSWPLQHSDTAYDSLPSKRRKKTKVPTHGKGERERYFADDDRYSLQDLVRREKTMEAEDQSAMMSRLASKQFAGTDSEYFTLDDMYVSEASKQSTRTEEEARQKQKAIADHRRLAQRLEKCKLCFGNPQLPKHLLIAIGKKSYLMLPDHKPLTEGHCFIVPMHHSNTGTSLDEDIWEELRRFMSCLRTMFHAQDMDCVFMQTCMGFKKSRHFFIDCIPMPREVGDLAPIYFKKAIQESESEWSHNKKLVDTRNKDVRRCIPKGLPYFSVDFGMDGGFAHVIEEESMFPFYFGREVVGGMLDVEPRLWRHPPKDHFTEQTKRSVQFAKLWKDYDWTADVTGIS